MNSLIEDFLNSKIYCRCRNRGEREEFFRIMISMGYTIITHDVISSSLATSFYVGTREKCIYLSSMSNPCSSKYFNEIFKEEY